MPLNPWIILALVVAWIGSLAVVGRWQNTAGHTAERVAWQAKESQELTAANNQILQLESAARAAEKLKQDTLAALAADYEKDLDNAETQRKADVAAARSGAIVLRDPNSGGSCAGASAPGAITASPGVSNGAPGGQLSSVATEFLLSEADRADGIVRQLAACQAVVQADRAP